MRRATKKPRTIEAPKSGTWTAGDRIGRLSEPLLREHRVQALVCEKIDVDLFIRVLDTLEESMVAARESEFVSDELVAEELPDAIRRVEEARKEAAEDQDEKVKAAEQNNDDLIAADAATREEHLKEIAELSRTIDELRKRALAAEHLVSISPEELTRTTAQLTEITRSANEAAERYKLERDAALAEVATLKRAVEVFRAEKPVKRVRKARA
jgi:hypothetical protein